MPGFAAQRIDTGEAAIHCVTAGAAFAEYLRCYRDPRTIRAICEDYRAAAGVDLDHDAEDAEASRCWRSGGAQRGGRDL